MRTTSYLFRLPASIMEEAKKAAAQDGVSLNQFISTALAEKASALRADWRTFDEVMSRAGGMPPRLGDEVPEP